ncbi:MAG: hypothetical protein EA409_03700 [Saprospirales bacterium]|nr:MAG: hypothetical protein EA409_03700 [Saprospirales bacterium]
MRIVKSFKHPFLVVEIFHYAEKYTLKIKDRGLEQSFPIPEEQLEGISRLLSDTESELYQQLHEVFRTMHHNWGDTLNKLKLHEQYPDEDEII